MSDLVLYDEMGELGPSRYHYFEWWLANRVTMAPIPLTQKFKQREVDRWGAKRRRHLSWAEHLEVLTDAVYVGPDSPAE